MNQIQNKLGGILLIVGLLCTTISVAQRPKDGRNPNQHLQKHMDQMQSQLKLTDSQISQLQPVFRDFFAERQQLRQTDSSDQQATRSSVEALERQTDPKIRAVLDAKQYEQWKKMREEHKRKAHLDGPPDRQ
jgi:Spy/CpxP family protein refolding chaperone